MPKESASTTDFHTGAQHGDPAPSSGAALASVPALLSSMYMPSWAVDPHRPLPVLLL